MTTPKLKLAPLPKKQLVRLTISLPAEIKTRLDRYAELHAEASGEKNDVARLIPYMLDAFMASDPAFIAASRTRSA